jgi:LemA protein
VRFDHRRLGAILGRALCTGESAAAAANADEIEGLIRHCELRAQLQRKPDDILRASITRGRGAIVISVVVILALSLALIVYLVGIYNGLVSLRENVKVAWANIDVLLKQRHDELPKLVDTCKRYMQFEQETLEKVMRARASVSLASSAGNVAAVGAAEQQLRAGVGRLFAVAENYPQLKTDETFKQLQGRIIALEESIADRRELYNDQVNLNNIRVNVYPDAVIARKFGFLPAQLLEFANEEKRDVNVSALFGT